jgi:hypothetical protein
MPKEAVASAEAQLTEAKTLVTAGKLPWETEDLLRWELATACILATKKDFKGAFDHLNPLATKYKDFLKSSHCKKTGLYSFFYFELANAAFHLGQVDLAKEYHKKSAKTNDYDLFRQLQVRLHTLKLKIKEREKGKK